MIAFKRLIMKLNTLKFFEKNANFSELYSLPYGVTLEKEHNPIYRFALLSSGIVLDLIAFSICALLWAFIITPGFLLFKGNDNLPPVLTPIIIAANIIATAVSIPVRFFATIVQPLCSKSDEEPSPANVL